MMNEVFSYLLVCGLGLLAGTIYFGGLWLTVQKLARSNNPILLSLLSYWSRLLLAGGCFYVVALSANWIHILVCLAGFMLVRPALVYWADRRNLNLRQG